MVILLPGRQRNKGAADELTKIKDEFQAYRDNVGHHFSKTAELVQSMTESYRSVYQHLAEGAQDLCDDRVTKLVVQFSESKLVEQEKAPAIGTAEISNQTEDETPAHIKYRKPVEVKSAVSDEKEISAEETKGAPESTEKPAEALAVNIEGSSSDVPDDKVIEAGADSDMDSPPVQGSSAVLRDMEKEAKAHRPH